LFASVRKVDEVGSSYYLSVTGLRATVIIVVVFHVVSERIWFLRSLQRRIRKLISSVSITSNDAFTYLIFRSVGLSFRLVRCRWTVGLARIGRRWRVRRLGVGFRCGISGLGWVRFGSRVFLGGVGLGSRVRGFGRIGLRSRIDRLRRIRLRSGISLGWIRLGLRVCGLRVRRWLRILGLSVSSGTGVRIRGRLRRIGSSGVLRGAVRPWAGTGSINRSFIFSGFISDGQLFLSGSWFLPELFGGGHQDRGGEQDTNK